MLIYLLANIGQPIYRSSLKQLIWAFVKNCTRDVTIMFKAKASKSVNT